MTDRRPRRMVRGCPTCGLSSVSSTPLRGNATNFHKYYFLSLVGPCDGRCISNRWDKRGSLAYGLGSATRAPCDGRGARTGTWSGACESQEKNLFPNGMAWREWTYMEVHHIRNLQSSRTSANLPEILNPCILKPNSARLCRRRDGR